MIFISFVIDAILSILIDNFIPLTIVSTIAFLSYYKNDDAILRKILIVGILYDVVYTNTIILNSLAFYMLYIVSLLFNQKFKKNLFNLLILNILLLIVYFSITYLILTLYQVINISIVSILKDILNCALFNTFYLSIIYFIIVKKMHKIKW